jgi:hypothetical protein
MPIMVGYSDKAATYASAEQMFLAHGALPLAALDDVRAESWTPLLTERERAQGYYFDFVEEGMIRGEREGHADELLGLVNGGLMYAERGPRALRTQPGSRSGQQQAAHSGELGADPTEGQLRPA